MTGSRRPSGMPTTLLKKLGLVGAALALPAFMWLLTPAHQRNTGAPATTASVQAQSPPLDAARPTAMASLPGHETYALALPALRGLSADTPPGTELKVWAAWEPPVTKQPRIQVLIESAVLKAIVPPTDPSVPPTALLMVRAEDLSDLLYGDRYGALSVTLPETP